MYFPVFIYIALQINASLHFCDHHPPNQTKYQYHSINKDRTHIRLSHLLVAQYLYAQPYVYVCSLVGYLKSTCTKEKEILLQ